MGWRVYETNDDNKIPGYKNVTNKYQRADEESDAWFHNAAQYFCVEAS